MSARVLLACVAVAGLLAGCAGATDAAGEASAPSTDSAPAPTASPAVPTANPEQPTASPAQPTGSPVGPTATAQPGQRTATAVVGGTSPIAVEVADDAATRAAGLMGRPAVPPGTGMVFVYPEPVARQFWMGNVLVPLSIAWVRDDRVVGIAEMTPCPAADNTCPRYSPGTEFDWAVETTGGTFTEAGVGIGDRAVVVPAAR